MAKNPACTLSSWGEFVMESKKAFEPPNNNMVLRQSLRNTRRTSFVADYVLRFRNISGQLRRSQVCC